MMKEKIELQMSRRSDNDFYLEIRAMKSRLMMFSIKLPPEKVVDLISSRTLEVDSRVYSEKMDNWFKKMQVKTIQVSTVGYVVFNEGEFEKWKRRQVSQYEQDGWTVENLDKMNHHKYNSPKGTYEVTFRRWV